MKKEKSNQKLIKIEKGVSKPSRLSFPFDNMEVGDSFVVPFNGRHENSVRMGTHSSAQRWAHRNKKFWRFTTAVERDKEQVRIWRVE